MSEERATYHGAAEPITDPARQALSDLFRCATFGHPVGQDRAYIVLDAHITKAAETATEHDSLKAEVERLKAENVRLTQSRDEAQSEVLAWQGVFDSLEAHIQDRVAMQDEANPQRYLDILRRQSSEVSRRSEQICAARWHGETTAAESIAALTDRLERAEARQIDQVDARHLCEIIDAHREEYHISEKALPAIERLRQAATAEGK